MNKSVNPREKFLRETSKHWEEKGEKMSKEEKQRKKD